MRKKYRLSELLHCKYMNVCRIFILIVEVECTFACICHNMNFSRKNILVKD